MASAKDSRGSLQTCRGVDAVRFQLCVAAFCTASTRLARLNRNSCCVPATLVAKRRPIASYEYVAVVLILCLNFGDLTSPPTSDLDVPPACFEILHYPR